MQSINERYCDVSDIYANSRECKFINAMLDALPMDIDVFKDAFVNYDRVTKLDAWHTELLVFIQKYMEWKTDAPPIDLLVGSGGGGGNVDDVYEEQPKSNIFAQADENNYNNSYVSNVNNNTKYEQHEPPDLSGAPDADLL